jgi:octaprenyl-diphosphate synthase
MHVRQAQTSDSATLLKRLSALCGRYNDPTLSLRLAELASWVHRDMATFEAELQGIEAGPSLVGRSANHLLSLGGKHLRPMCVMLAAKMGTGFDHRGRELAMAVELVHSATLLHDDVVDQGAMRRGQPTSRILFGNAASIFAGDWLLVKALQCIRRSGGDELLGRMLDIIDEMIMAESVQLENRGHINTRLRDYFHVVEGKTAALFRWAMYAGARIGGLDERNSRALEDYGPAKHYLLTCTRAR